MLSARGLFLSALSVPNYDSQIYWFKSTTTRLIDFIHWFIRSFITYQFLQPLKTVYLCFPLPAFVSLTVATQRSGADCNWVYITLSWFQNSFWVLGLSDRDKETSFSMWECGWVLILLILLLANETEISGDLAALFLWEYRFDDFRCLLIIYLFVSNSFSFDRILYFSQWIQDFVNEITLWTLLPCTGFGYLIS